MSRTSAFLLGALGGLLPLLVSLLTVDLASIVDHHSALTLGNYVGYGVRVLVLLTLGGIVAVLNSEVRQPLSLVQLGIAAPALVTSFINGAPPPSRTAGNDHASLAIISTATAAELGGRRMRLAGSFLSDVLSGSTMRLDHLNESNRTVLPPPPSTICVTSNGSFPVDANTAGAIGTPCETKLPNGDTVRGTTSILK